MKLYLYSSTKYLIPLAVLAGGWIYLFGAHLPYFNTDPIKLAEYLARHGRSPEECWDLVVLDPFGPQAAVSRAGCIHKYAEVMKDPAACELLMPSRYGLSCVGAAEESLPCSGGSKPYSVYWRDGEKGNEESVRSCAAHPGGRSPLGNACCVVAQVAWLKDHNDCSAVKNMADVYDRCLAAMAWKKADPSYCEGMRDGNPKVACQVQTKALKEDPSICERCAKALNDISELK